MNRHLSANRLYRERCSPRENETRFQVVLEQTDLYIIAQRDLSNEALEEVQRLRGILKAYITLRPEFAESLIPIEAAPGAHEMIRDMCLAAKLCNVGPMAAVAGAIAQRTAKALSRFSSEVLVENGGDIYLYSTRDRRVGILPDPVAEATLGLLIPKEQFPVSICSSSATIGHSLSLGKGELMVVMARNACLADAAATALCNMLKEAKDIDRVLQRGQTLAKHGVLGLLAMMGGKLGVWGDMELVAL